MRVPNLMSTDLLNRAKTRCPECLAPIYLGRNMVVSTLLNCPECHTLLEVTSLDSFEVDYVLDDEPNDGQLPEDSYYEQ